MSRFLHSVFLLLALAATAHSALAQSTETSPISETNADNATGAASNDAPITAAPTKQEEAKPAPVAPVTVEQTPTLPRYNLEIGGFFGGTYVTGGGQNFAPSSADTQIGWDAALTVAYRSPYFLLPFLDVSYASLASSYTDIAVPNTTALTHVATSLHAWNIALGPGIDFWRLRFRFGVGLLSAGVSNTVGIGASETNNSASGAGVSSLMALSGDIISIPRFRTGLEARIVHAPGANFTYYTVGVTFRGDAFQWQ